MNTTDRLAYLRTAWALERTQLAWIRTSFGLSSAGLAIDKGAFALHEAKLLIAPDWVNGGYFAGIALSAIAAVQLVVATFVYVSRARELAREGQVKAKIIPEGLLLSVIVILFSITISVMLTLVR